MNIIQNGYIFINSRELCPEQACKLCRGRELARVKLSGLYCKLGLWLINVRDRIRIYFANQYLFKRKTISNIGKS